MNDGNHKYVLLYRYNCRYPFNRYLNSISNFITALCDPHNPIYERALILIKVSGMWGNSAHLQETDFPANV